MVIIVKNQFDLNCKVLEYSAGVCKMLYRSVNKSHFLCCTQKVWIDFGISNTWDSVAKMVLPNRENNDMPSSAITNHLKLHLKHKLKS